MVEQAPLQIGEFTFSGENPDPEELEVLKAAIAQFEEWEFNFFAGMRFYNREIVLSNEKKLGFTPDGKMVLSLPLLKHTWQLLAEDMHAMYRDFFLESESVFARRDFHPGLHCYFIRDNNILDPCNPQVVELTAHVKGITDELLRANGYDPVKEDVHVVLFRNDRADAWHQPNVTPPMIGFNIDYLRRVQSEDRLAQTIGHELTHHLIKHTNSKQQEVAAQANGLRMALNAGYNPKVIVQDHQGNRGAFDEHAEFEHTFDDDHANAALDLREMENVLAVAERSKGKRFDSTPTPLPNWFRNTAYAAPDRSHLPGSVDLRRLGKQFDNADAIGRIRLAASAIQVSEVGQKTCKAMLRRVQFDPQKPEEVAAFNALVRATCGLYGPNRLIYYDLATSAWLRSMGISPAEYESARQKDSFAQEAQAQGKDDESLPQYREPDRQRIRIGELKTLEETFAKFMASETADEAAEHAKVIVQLNKEFVALNRSYLEELDFPPIRIASLAQSAEILKEKGVYALPYTKHLGFIRATQNADIAKALAFAGVVNDDPFAFKIVNETFGGEENEQNPIYLAKRSQLVCGDHGLPGNKHAAEAIVRDLENAFKAWQRDENGNVTGLLHKVPPLVRRQGDTERGEFDHLREGSDYAIISEEYAALSQRLEWEKEWLAKADWSRLRTNFDEFIYQYQALLQPVSGAAVIEFPFAERFLEEMERLMRDPDPAVAEQAKQKLHDYLTHTQKGSFRYDADALIQQMSTALSANRRVPEINKQRIYSTIHPKHPLVEFVVCNPLGMFDDYDRNRMLDRTRVLSCATNETYVSESALYFWPNILYPDINMRASNDAEFFASMKAVSHHMSDYDQVVRNLLIEDQLERHRFNATEPTLDMITYLLQNLAYTTEYDFAVVRKVRQTAQKLIPQQFAAAKSFSDQVLVYRNYATTGLLTDQQSVRANLAAALAKRFEDPSVPDEEKFKAAQMLAECKTDSKYLWQYEGKDEALVAYRYDGMIEDPQLRRQVMQHYAQKLANDLGLDDGSDDYRENLAISLRHCEKSMSNQLFGYLLPELAHRIEAQEEVAYLLRDKFISFGVDSVMSQGTVGKYADFFTNELTKSHSGRAAVELFLTKPYTEENGGRFLETISNVAQNSRDASHFYYSNSKNVTEHGRQAAAYFHKNFWAAPLEARVWYTEKLLFPINIRAESEHHAQVQKIIDRVLPLRASEVVDDYDPLTQRTLPKLDEYVSARKAQRALQQQQQKHGFSSGSATVARAIVQSYLSVIPVGEQRLLATAMLVADGAGVTTGKPNVGKTLYMVLSQMGPAGTKLLQAINNHPQTPASLKAELAQCQTMHNVPNRWDIIAWLKGAGAGKEPGSLQVRRYGKVLGSASLGVAVMNELPDLTHVADTLLRPYAKDQALLEFDNMLQAVDRMVQEHAELSIVRDMVEEAKRSILVETDFGLAQKLNTASTQAYDGIRVSVQENGKTYEFTNHVVPISQANDNLKRAELAEGEHFIDLPETTPEERDYKRAAAKAMLTTVLGVRLGGLPADKDRHGGNVKVRGGTLGHFDTGAQELLMPTLAQKRALGTVLGTSLQKAMATTVNGNAPEFDKLLVQEMENANEDPSVRAFLAGVKREFLATGAYRGVSTQGDETMQLTLADIKDILGCLIAQETIDPDILDGFKAGLGESFPFIMTMLKPSDAPSVHISGLRENIDAYKPVELSEEEIALVTPDASLYSRPSVVETTSATPADEAVETEMDKKIRAFTQDPKWQFAMLQDMMGARVPPILDKYAPAFMQAFKRGEIDLEKLPELYFEAMYDAYRLCTHRYAADRGFHKGIGQLLESDCPETWAMFSQFAAQELDYDADCLARHALHFDGPGSSVSYAVSLGSENIVPGGFADRLNRQRNLNYGRS